MGDQPNSPITLGERLATAFAAAFVTIITLLVLPWIAGFSGKSGETLMIYLWVFSKPGLVVVIGAAGLGFFLGSERMANVLSFFGGTHKIWDEEWASKLILDLCQQCAVFDGCGGKVGRGMGCAFRKIIVWRRHDEFLAGGINQRNVICVATVMY